MLVYPSSIDLSNRTLRFLTGRLKARRQEIGTRWRRLLASRQGLLALAHLRRPPSAGRRRGSCSDQNEEMGASRNRAETAVWCHMI